MGVYTSIKFTKFACGSAGVALATAPESLSGKGIQSRGAVLLVLHATDA